MKLIGLPKKRIQHEGNRDQVVKYVLKKEPGACIGLIDEDPDTARTTQRARFIVGRTVADLHTENSGKRRLLVLHPMLEGWLIKAVRACGGSMAKLDKGLSDDPNSLHKQLSPKGDPRMVKIVEFLERNRSEHLNQLREQLGLVPRLI